MAWRCGLLPIDSVITVGLRTGITGSLEQVVVDDAPGRPPTLLGSSARAASEVRIAPKTYPFADRSAALCVAPTNPKKHGTASWDRYERYKTARTVGEFLDRGGTPGDLRHDWARGYVTQASAAPGDDTDDDFDELYSEVAAAAPAAVVTTPEMLAVLGDRSRKRKVTEGGCRCKKTRCLKRYCSCYNAGIKCVAECKCLDCQNGRPASVDQVAPSVDQVAPRALPSMVLPPSPQPLKMAATAPPASRPSQPEPSKKRSAPSASKPKPKKKFKPKDAVMEAFVKRLTQPYAPPPPRPPASDLEESDSEVVDTT